MKKILYLLILPMMLATIVSCSDELDELWKNPNKYTPPSDLVCSGLFSHMQKTRFWQKDYGEWYWMLGNGSIPVMAQITAGIEPAVEWNNNAGEWVVYEAGIKANYINIFYPDPTRAPGYSTNNQDKQRFNWFYTELTNFGLIRDEVKTLEGADYDDNVIYHKLASILKDVVALQTVDLFNKIPYTRAFEGSVGVFFAPYDNPEDIYKSVLEEYQNTVKELPDIYAKMSKKAKATFATQDIFFKGDVNKWIQYINAQILRSCIRVSGVASNYSIDIRSYLTDAVKNLPKEDFTMAPRELNQCRWGKGGDGGIFPRGLNDRFWRLTIPDHIMMRMNRGDIKYDPSIDDPRLPVIGLGFTPDSTTTNVEYYGVSGNWDRNLRVMAGSQPGEAQRRNLYPQTGGKDAIFIDDNYWAARKYVLGAPWTFYNPMTYIVNDIQFNIETLAEVDLFLAEAVLKDLVSTGKSAGTHIADAVNHSTTFWYMINNQYGSVAFASELYPFETLERTILMPQNPGSAAYATLISQEFDAAAGTENKMEIIMQQKYIHLNLIGVYELFAELRRTRHPKLEPITLNMGTDNDLNNASMIIERVPYPNSERINNAEEYAKVQKEDNWTSPVFWVPQDKISEKYFLPQAIKLP